MARECDQGKYRTLTYGGQEEKGQVEWSYDF